MRVSTAAFTNNFISQVQSLQQQEVALQNQSTTGLKMSLPEDDPATMGAVLNLQTASSANAQYQDNITALQTSATTSYTAMDSLKTISDRVGEIATLASSGTTSTTQMSSYATEVDGLLQQAVQIGNTKDASGNYIFGGTATSSPPFTAVTNSSGQITSVTYNGNNAVAKSEISSGVTISANVPGASGNGEGGLFTSNNSGADIFSHLISLRDNLTAGNNSAIGTTDAPNLAKDETNIISHISANSLMQSTLSSSSTLASSTATNISTAISNDTSADMATTLTELNQTQTAYQAALASGTKILSLSILDYLQ